MNLLEITFHASGFFQSSDKREHYAQVGTSVNTPCKLESFKLPIMEVAGNTTITDHGVIFVSFKQEASEKVTVLVGFEVCSSVDNIAAIKSHGKQGQPLG